MQTYNTRYASFFNLAYPELELDNPLSRMHCIHYASSLYGKLRDKMTGRFNQDLPKNLQMAFKKATNFEPGIITKQSINNRKVHKVNHIDITQREDEIEINEAHVKTRTTRVRIMILTTSKTEQRRIPTRSPILHQANTILETKVTDTTRTTNRINQ